MADVTRDALYDNSPQPPASASTAPSPLTGGPAQHRQEADGGNRTSTGRSTADVMYGSPLENEVKDRAGELFDAGASQASIDALRDSFVGIEKATNLPRDILVDLLEAHLDDVAALGRGADPETMREERIPQIQRQNAEIREQLRIEYGAKRAEEVLDRAIRFCRQSKPLMEILQTGLGSRPDIALRIVKHVVATGWGKAK